MLYPGEGSGLQAVFKHSQRRALTRGCPFPIARGHRSNPPRDDFYTSQDSPDISTLLTNSSKAQGGGRGSATQMWGAWGWLGMGRGRPRLRARGSGKSSEARGLAAALAGGSQQHLMKGALRPWR
jgi:hypothetical protein